MEDEAEIYDGIRAQFPLSFGKQAKSLTPLESIHNSTRRSNVLSDNGDSLSTSKALPSLSSSSKSWLNSLRNSDRNPNSRNASAHDTTKSGQSSEFYNNDGGGMLVGPPRPPPDIGSGDDEEEEDDGEVMIGPPRPPENSTGNDGEDDDVMIGPPPPPPGSNLAESESDGELDVEEQNPYRIPLSNEIVLKGHTKVLLLSGSFLS